MEVVLGLLADAANTTDSQKLNVLGVFSNINAPTFPVQHPAMQIVLRFEADPVERGQEKKIDIRLVDQDGAELLKVDGQFVVPPDAPSGSRIQMQAIIGLAGVTFQKAGAHAFVVMVNGEGKFRIPLTLTQKAEAEDGVE